MSGFSRSSVNRALQCLKCCASATLKELTPDEEGNARYTCKLYPLDGSDIPFRVLIFTEDQCNDLTRVTTGDCNEIFEMYGCTKGVRAYKFLELILPDGFAFGSVTNRDMYDYARDERTMMCSDVKELISNKFWVRDTTKAAVGCKETNLGYIRPFHLRSESMLKIRFCKETLDNKSKALILAQAFALASIALKPTRDCPSQQADFHSGRSPTGSGMSQTPNLRMLSCPDDWSSLQTVSSLKLEKVASIGETFSDLYTAVNCSNNRKLFILDFRRQNSGLLVVRGIRSRQITFEANNVMLPNNKSNVLDGDGADIGHICSYEIYDQKHKLLMYLVRSDCGEKFDIHRNCPADGGHVGQIEGNIRGNYICLQMPKTMDVQHKALIICYAMKLGVAVFKMRQARVPMVSSYEEVLCL